LRGLYWADPGYGIDSIPLNKFMRLNEFAASSLKKYKAIVKVKSTSVKTIIHAESQSHARMLLDKMFGKDNVQSVTESKL
jgi:myo-inositol catabolism protein IolC